MANYWTPFCYETVISSSLYFPDNGNGRSVHDAQVIESSQTRVVLASQAGHEKKCIFVATKSALIFWWPSCEARVVYNHRNLPVKQVKCFAGERLLVFMQGVAVNPSL